MKIGIFGGSFNPPHSMHKKIALNLIFKKYLDKVIFVPTGDKYNKKDLIKATHRHIMLKIMIQDEKKLEVSDYEIKNFLTYTYQTLDYFQNKYPNDQIYFICGSDNLKDIKNWKKNEYILTNYKVIVIKRNNDKVSEIIKNLNTSNIILAKIPFENVSSSSIRRDLKEKNSCKNLDYKIKQYIKENHLYE